MTIDGALQASTEDHPEMSAVMITDELIDNMRARIGTHLRTEGSRSNEEATMLAIQRFADGIGDDNPLWTDRKYAAASAYRGIVAPPSWVLCCFSGMQFGWPGLGGFHSSTEMKFHRPVRLGDRIVPDAVYEGFDGPRASTFAGRSVVDRNRTTYHNQHGEKVCDYIWRIVRFERGSARERAPDRKFDLPHPWKPEEIAAIEARILGERPRGREIRWWDDVQVGDTLDEIIKGPLGITDEIAFVATGAAPIPRLAANGVALRRYSKHPKWAFRDADTGAQEPIYAVHYNHRAARAMGVAGAYDVGVQRTCWQVHALTHWAGDDAWLKSLAGEYRAFVYLSDVVALGGRVIDKFIDEDGDAVVRVETSCINQRGKDVMPGQATIALCSRDGLHPTKRFLDRASGS